MTEQARNELISILVKHAAVLDRLQGGCLLDRPFPAKIEPPRGQCTPYPSHRSPENKKAAAPQRCRPDYPITRFPDFQSAGPKARRYSISSRVNASSGSTRLRASRYGGQAPLLYFVAS